MVHAFIIKDLFDLFFRAGGEDFGSGLEMEALEVQLQLFWKGWKSLNFCLAFLFSSKELILSLGFVESSGEIAQGLLYISEFFIYFRIVDDGLRKFFDGLEVLTGWHIKDVRSLDVSGLESFHVGLDVRAEDVGDLWFLHFLVHSWDHHALWDLSAVLLLQSLYLLIFFLNLIRLDANIFLQSLDFLVLFNQASL